jgi:hypothetical protein
VANELENLLRLNRTPAMPRGSNRLARYVEPAMTAGSTMLAEIPAYAAGMAELNQTGLPSEGVRRAEEVSERLTYNPRTMEGQAGLQSLTNGVMKVMDALGVDEAVNYLNNTVVPRIQKTFGETAAREIGSSVMMSLPFVRKVPGLKMDQASRMQRAEDLGFDDEELFIGSTYDIEDLDLDRMHSDSHFGKAIYTTTSLDDASINYAGEGPDLTNRIQQKADELSGMGEHGRELGRDYVEEARSILKGDNEGVVYPVVARSDKIFDISEYGDEIPLSYVQRQMDADDYIDDAKLDVYEEDFNSPEAYNEALKERAEDLAVEDSYNFEPEGDAIDFMDALRRDPRLSSSDADELIMRIDETARDYEGITPRQLDSIMRETEYYAENPETGAFENSDVYRQALERSGYDTIIMDADTFQNMEGVEGAKHKIFLQPERIRSKNAEFDPEKKESSNILSSILNQRFKNVA